MHEEGMLAEAAASLESYAQELSAEGFTLTDSELEEFKSLLSEYPFIKVCDLIDALQEQKNQNPGQDVPLPASRQRQEEDFCKCWMIPKLTPTCQHCRKNIRGGL